MVNSKTVIVLGGQYGALSVIKALSEKGIEVILLSPNPNDHACHSKYIKKLVTIPDPKVNSPGLLEFLMSEENKWENHLLIPTLDEYVIFIAQNKAELSKKYLFTVQDWDITKELINKDRLYTHAKELGVLTPGFYFPENIDFLYENKDKFQYPCILKPYETFKFRALFKKKVFVVDNFDELCARYQEAEQHQIEVMISEIVPGDDATIFSYRSYIDSQGEVLADMCTQKLHQYPTGFGQGSLLRSIQMIPELQQSSLKLLKTLKFRGESSTEYRLDRRDNQYKLMEINIRPAVTEWLVIKAGLNFPYLTYLDLVENQRNQVTDYIIDLYWIHNHWEMANFYLALRSGKFNFREYMDLAKKKKVYLYSIYNDPIHYITELFILGKRAILKNN